MLTAVYNIYNADRWFALSLASIWNNVDNVSVGVASDIPDLAHDKVCNILQFFTGLNPNKISFHRVGRATQFEGGYAELKNLCLKRACDRFPGTTHILYPDGDHIFYSKGISKIKELMSVENSKYAWRLRFYHIYRGSNNSMWTVPLVGDKATQYDYMTFSMFYPYNSKVEYRSKVHESLHVGRDWKARFDIDCVHMGPFSDDNEMLRKIVAYERLSGRWSEDDSDIYITRSLLKDGKLPEGFKNIALFRRGIENVIPFDRPLPEVMNNYPFGIFEFDSSVKKDLVNYINL